MLKALDNNLTLGLAGLNQSMGFAHIFGIDGGVRLRHLRADEPGLLVRERVIGDMAMRFGKSNGPSDVGECRGCVIGLSHHFQSWVR